MLALEKKRDVVAPGGFNTAEPDDAPRYIDVRDVSLWLGRPPHRRLALQRVNLSSSKRRIIGLVGPSGSGKSTLLKTIGGLLKPDRGEVLIGTRPAPEAMRSNKFGLVFQQPVLLPWRTVEENVTFTAEIVQSRRGILRQPEAKKQRTERARSLLDMVGLDNHVHKYPRELSGGMQQRVSIARALMTEPEILLMDEPFGALDEIIRERLNLMILDIWEKTNITIVFVTHSLSEASFLADDIYVMGADPGRIIDDVAVPLPRPRTLATYRLQAFTDLTMYLRGAIGGAEDARGDDQT